jgi:hypothetical protein
MEGSLVVVKRHMSAVLEAMLGGMNVFCIGYFGQEFGGSKSEGKILG